MKFCTKCGKQLEDGEVCTCQGAQEAQAAGKPIITKEQATEISKGMLSFAGEYVKNPVEASKAVVGEHSLITVLGLAAVNAVLAVLVRILVMVINTIKYEYLDYGVKDWLKGIFAPLVTWIAIPAALAGLVWLVAKFLEKKEVKFTVALSTFAPAALPLMVRSLVSLLDALLTAQFFDWIFGIIRNGVGAIMVYLTGIAIAKLVKNTEKNFVYDIAAISAGLGLAYWIINSAIF